MTREAEPAPGVPDQRSAPDAVLQARLRDLESAARHTAMHDRALQATTCSFTIASALDPDYPLVWVNEAFTRTTGYSADEVLGRNCRFLQGPETEATSVADVRAALSAGRDITAVLLNYRKDGTTFWNQVSISPVEDADGRTTHLVGVQVDVTASVEADRTRVLALAAERAARAEAEAARRQAHMLGLRMSLVAEATGLLAATLDVDESLDRLARLAVPLLADWVVLDLAGDSDDGQHRSFLRHRDGEADLLERCRVLLAAGAATGVLRHDLLRGGPPRLLARYDPHAEAPPTAEAAELQDVLAQLGARSVLLVPLTARLKVVGTMTLVQGLSQRDFDEDDLRLAADLGRRAGLAIDNADMYTRERSTAVTLQHSMLPSLPQVPGLALAAEYRPAGRDSQVGGDWWDVFVLPDSTVGVAVGDVMGHDIAAAAAMGQLRSVLRTCAWAGDDPAEVLGRMDRLVQGFDMAQLATCFYARLEPADPAARPTLLPRLSWSSAGHLPPVVLDADGRAFLLQASSDVPIGVPSTEARRQSSTTLAPGATLLLYTDGLVETRGGDIDDDVDRLVAKVRAHRPSDGPQVLIDRLLSGLGVLADDVALLAAQVLPPPPRPR